MPGRVREEVLNVLLAQLLDERGVVSVPEVIENWESGRRLPDVLVEFQGLRTVIEGKVASATAEQEVAGQAASRVEEGVAHIGIGVVYPSELRQAGGVPEIRAAMPKGLLRINICTEQGEQGWMDSDLDELAALLRRTFEQLVSEDVVARAVEAIESGIDRFTRAIKATPAAIERCAEVLGIGEPDESNGEDEPA